jgi:hypothetical protein
MCSNPDVEWTLETSLIPENGTVSLQYAREQYCNYKLTLRQFSSFSIDLAEDGLHNGPPTHNRSNLTSSISKPCKGKATANDLPTLCQPVPKSDIRVSEQVRKEMEEYHDWVVGLVMVKVVDRCRFLVIRRGLQLGQI